MALANLANNVAGLTLAAAYTAGTSSTFQLSAGASLLPAPPFRITVVTAGTYQTSSETLTIYEVTAVAGEVLTVGVSSPIEGTTDRNFAIGDRVDLRLTAGTISDLNTAVTPVQTTGITAAGTNQATATALAAPTFFASPATFVVSTVASGTGVVLPAAIAGMDITVVNAGANPLLVYPATGGSIDGAAANAPMSIPPAGGAVNLVAYGTTVGGTTGTWNRAGSRPPNVQLFTASGTWTRPPGCTTVRVDLVGGGGGGGQGGSGTGSFSGGAGGSGGSGLSRQFAAADLTATVTVTVGGPAAGGSTTAAGAGAGQAGANGVATTFGGYATAPGGPGGAGGSTATASTATTTPSQFSGGAGGNCGAGSPGSAGGSATGLAGGGGAGGGGVATGSSLSKAGATGGAAYDFSAASGGAYGGTGVSGGAGSSTLTPVGSEACGGSGGGGGGGLYNGTPGNGGNGGTYGGGGGGGGATGASWVGGAGGNGGAGVCVVIAW